VAKKFPLAARALCRQSPFAETLATSGYSDAAQLPLGAIIAVVDLVDMMRFDQKTLPAIRRGSKQGTLPPHEAEFGDFSAGRFGFVVQNVRKLREPIPARRMLSLWTMPAELEAVARIRKRCRAVPLASETCRPDGLRFGSSIERFRFLSSIFRNRLGIARICRKRHLQ
jgi:hypothetical protein